MFLRDIRSEPMQGYKLKIPKMHPCTITKMNSSHIWVDYKGQETFLRLILERMIPAGPAAKILYGVNNDK